MNPPDWLALKNFVRQHIIPLSLAVLGATLILVGVVSIIVSNGSEPIAFEDVQGEDGGELFVDVSGAVVRPGLYKLRGGGRIQDALIAAGGLSASADREWVAKVLNLAGKLTDGQKIYIPKAGESVSQKTQNIGGSANQIIGGSEGLINLNTATAAQLDKLPGIGPVTAQKIIDNRPYSDVNDLVSKKVVGNKVFGQIKDKVSVY